MIKVYWDLDGTLAKWRTAATTEDLYKKNYFLSLEPETELCKLANKLVRENEVDSYILTSFLADSAYAKYEKLVWAKKHVNELPSGKILCVPYGIRKSSFVEDIEHKELSKEDILIDDHSPNLIAWEQAGGTAIKWCNGINDSRKSKFTGVRARAIDTIYNTIYNLLTGYANVTMG